MNVYIGGFMYMQEVTVPDEVLKKVESVNRRWRVIDYVLTNSQMLQKEVNNGKIQKHRHL